MNARLQEDAAPAREVNPDISAELEEILRRALARDPRQRYASARDFAADLRHPSGVHAEARPPARPPLPKKVLLYSTLAAIPVTIFALLLYVAGRQ